MSPPGAADAWQLCFRPVLILGATDLCERPLVRWFELWGVKWPFMVISLEADLKREGIDLGNLHLDDTEIGWRTQKP